MIVSATFLAPTAVLRLPECRLVPPLKVQFRCSVAIVARRPPSSATMPIAAFAASSGSAVTTIGATPKKVFTIVSWNVEGFGNTKALANPYVNGVLRSVLSELDADVYLILETDEDASVNLAAVEHELANAKNTKLDDSTPEDWDLKELEAEAANVAKNAEALAA